MYDRFLYCFTWFAYFLLVSSWSKHMHIVVAKCIQISKWTFMMYVCNFTFMLFYCFILFDPWFISTLRHVILLRCFIWLMIYLFIFLYGVLLSSINTILTLSCEWTSSRKVHSSIGRSEDHETSYKYNYLVRH
jgi:hypothetical protein